MKDGLIFLLLVLLVLALAGRGGGPRAQIQDVTLSHADYQRCITVSPGPLKPSPATLSGRGHVSEIA